MGGVYSPLDELSEKELLVEIASELKQLNEGLRAGSLNIRTHHPLCVTPKDGVYSVQLLEAMGQYLNKSIDTGALALPQKGGQS